MIGINNAWTIIFISIIETIIDVYNNVFDLLERITVYKNTNSMQHLVLSL